MLSEQKRIPLIIVSGPTASGKSGFAVRLAKEVLPGEIINLDSVQVFRTCDIGSAKVTEAEKGGVPHHLIDVLDPTTPTDAAWLTRHARESAQEIWSRGKMPYMVGSSGMYVSALLEGLSPLPPGDTVLRESYAVIPLSELYLKLHQVDPILAAKLHPNDRIRIERALEVFELTGTPASTWYSTHSFHHSFAPLILILIWDRSELYERIGTRAEQMITAGLEKETEGLLSTFGADAPPLSAIGYKEMSEYLRKERSMESVGPAIAQATRRYAKRQMTYWRNEPQKRGWEIYSPEPSQELEGFPCWSVSYSTVREKLSTFLPEKGPRVVFLQAPNALID